MRNSKYFWLIQGIAWGGLGLSNFLAQSLIPAISAKLIIFNSLILSIGGFLLSSLYRHQIKKRNWKIWCRMTLLKFILSSTLLVTTFWLILTAALYYALFGMVMGNFPTLISSLFPLILIMLLWNACYFGYHLIRQSHLSEIEKWKLKAEVQKAQFGILKAQINPHFMFNALNNIKALILEDKHLARKMISEFSEILRYSLIHTDSREVALVDELDIVRQYLNLLKIQYEDKLLYTIDHQETVSNEKIPPLILQLLVENAVKHGISHSATGGSITIETSREDKSTVLRVKNTGSLAPKHQLENSLGVGLKNIRERLRLLYGDLASLTINEENQFVHVTVQIPHK